MSIKSSHCTSGKAISSHSNIGVNFKLSHELNDLLEHLAIAEFRSKRKQVEYFLHRKYSHVSHCVTQEKNPNIETIDSGIGIYVELSETCNAQLIRNAAANKLTKKEQILLDLTAFLEGE